MRGFFSKRWRGIPLGIIMAVIAVIVIAGGVFAAYKFTSVTVNMEVREPMAVTMDLSWDSAGVIVVPAAGLAFDDACTAGDIGTIAVTVQNKSSGDITITSEVSGAGAPYFVITGLPSGVLLANTTWTGTVTVKVKNDAPPSAPGAHSYPITINFSRS